jgi:hypothetical protein
MQTDGTTCHSMSIFLTTQFEIWMIKFYLFFLTSYFSHLIIFSFSFLFSYVILFFFFQINLCLLSHFLIVFTNTYFLFLFLLQILYDRKTIVMLITLFFHVFLSMNVFEASNEITYFFYLNFLFYFLTNLFKYVCRKKIIKWCSHKADKKNTRYVCKISYLLN